jgi:pheromone shutdown protein TraB
MMAMKMALKYITVLIAFICAGYSTLADRTGTGIAAAGAFIAYALIEIQDLKIINEEKEGWLEISKPNY